MAVIDPTKVPLKTGSIYPAPYAEQMAGRSSLRLAEAGGLTQFGVNMVILKPGARSSLRHWHHFEDEFVMVMEGTCTLIDDDGPHELQPGDCAAFPAGEENGHHFVNNTNAEARFLVVGGCKDFERVTYSDVDLMVEIIKGRDNFTHKNGCPYKSPEMEEVK